MLQWGRTLSSAESDPELRRRQVAIGASMGPHSFKCGKLVAVLLAIRRLQCFNGAALFQVRKEKKPAGKRRRAIGFNGAALFQVRKEI